jgi:thioredoxin 1
MGAVIDTDSGRFDEDVLRSSVPVLLDLWSPTCGPCRAIAPHIERLAQKHAGRLKVVKANTAQEPTFRDRFSLLGVPTLIMFAGGKEVDRVVGGYPQKIEAMVEKALASQPEAPTEPWTPPPPPSLSGQPSVAAPVLPPIDQVVRRR